MAVVTIALQSPLPLVNAHADEIVEFLLHILGSDAEMNLKDSSALVSHGSHMSEADGEAGRQAGTFSIDVQADGKKKER